MSLIQIVISIVLAGLLLTVGVFYGGSSYTGSRSSIMATELIGEINQVSDAVKLFGLRGGVPPSENMLGMCVDTDGGLVKEGICNSHYTEYMMREMQNVGLINNIPFFDEGGERLEYVLANGSKYSEIGGIVAYVTIRDKELCNKVNEMAGRTATGALDSSPGIGDVVSSKDGGGAIDFAKAYIRLIDASEMSPSIHCSRVFGGDEGRYSYMRVYKIIDMPRLLNLKNLG